MVEKEYIAKEFVIDAIEELKAKSVPKALLFDHLTKLIEIFPTEDFTPVRHGRWLYEVHKENVNFRWNVTAECSECCDNRKEIWGGFFPNVPDCIARDIALQNAKQIKLDNYCPNCGVKIDKED